MARSDDPFERAVAREHRMRERASAFSSRSGVVKMAVVWLGALGVGWALLLIGHWVLLPDPRWLVVVHTVGFALTAGYWLVSLAFLGSMKRARPDVFEDL